MEPGLDEFENPQLQQMTINKKTKKWLLRKDEIQSNVRKTWSKDEIEGNYKIIYKDLRKVTGTAAYIEAHVARNQGRYLG